MAEVPEDYDSGPDENEDLESERPKQPRPPKIDEDAEPDITAKTGLKLLEEIHQEPQPETEEEKLKDRTPESAETMHPHLKSTRISEEEILKESEIDLSNGTEIGISQEVMMETSREMRRKLFKDLEVPMDEKQEQPDLKPAEETKPDVTEGVFIESAQETNLELPKETESEVPQAIINETRVELLEETKLGVPEELLREQNEEPSEQIKPEFPSEKPRKVIEDRDLQSPEMTTPEFPEETQQKSSEEKSTEPSELTKLEFTEEKPIKSTKEAGLELLEKTMPAVSEDTGRKPPEEKGTEQIKPEFPDQKPIDSTATQRKLTEEKVPEPLEEIKSEFPGKKSRTLVEKTGLESTEKTKPEIQEETQRKSTVKKVLKPPEDTEPTVIKNKQRKSIEIGLAPPQKSKTEGILSESTEKKGLQPPEQTTPWFLKKEPETPSKSTPQLPLQNTKSKLQKKTQREPTKNKDLELPDKAKLLFGQETHDKFTKEDRPKPISFKHFVGEDDLEQSDYQIKLLVKGTKKLIKDISSFTVREVESVNIDDYFSKEHLLLSELTSKDLYSSDSQRDLSESLSEEVLDLFLKLEDKKETQQKERTEPQFEYLNWSPEKVAEWISELGFPQYKECFITNFISGRKLIHVNCSNLPQIGITDFEDMKAISRHTRALLGFEEPLFKRSIRLPHRDNIGLFLEQKGHTGETSDSLTYSEFVQKAGLQDYEPQITAPDKN
ncbi:sterile alpha motif domain-containing protein 15 [Myotis yumanensis]|uniref:sterile alpha motif domain-containing protein 15 n=1 Tax=Myotis yumanensis TaxID=159337 RepID=UPI0038D0838E